MPALRYDFNLSEPSNWILLEQAEVEAEEILGTSKFVPLLSRTTTITSNFVLVGITSASAKPHWAKGADAVVFFDAPPSQAGQLLPVTAISKFCRLKYLTSLHIPRYQPPPYYLSLHFPRWLKSVRYEIWEYVGKNGEDLNRDAATRWIQEKLNAIEDLLT